MPVSAAIFDAFGTLIQINEGSHPFRKILKLGIEQGRRPQSTDAEQLLTLPMDLRQAADFWHPGRSIRDVTIRVRSTQ